MKNNYKFFANGVSGKIRFSRMVGDFSHDWDATGINPMDVAADTVRKTFPDARFSSLRVRRFSNKEEKELAK